MIQDQQGRRVYSMPPSNMDEDGVPTCPECGCTDTRVENSYPFKEGLKRRRRVCNHCQLPFHTIQPAEMTEW